MKQFIQLMLVQFREFYREPGVLFWSLGFPVLMAWGLGIAFNKQGELVRNIAWVQQNQGTVMNKFLSNNNPGNEESRKIGNQKTGYTIYKFIKSNWNDAELMVKRGKSALIVYEKSDSLQYYFDPRNPEAELAYLQITTAMKNEADNKNNQSIRPFSQKGMRYVDFLVPGLIAMNIMMSAMWGISYSLIEKRTKKLLRRMVATPMSKATFLFSHFVARLILSFIESLLVYVFAWWYFGITVQGSAMALILMIIAGNIAFFGLAVLSSSRTSNTQVGNGLLNAVVMPMMICSGIFFSYHNFPDWLVKIIQKLPLTFLADNIRSIFIEGSGLVSNIGGIVVLSVSGLIFFLIGMRMYKWY